MEAVIPWTAADPIGRDEARELARRELEKPIYHRDDPSLLDRMLGKIDQWLQELFSKLPGQHPQGGGGSTLALIVVILLILTLIGLLLWRMRGGRNTRSERGALLEKPSMAKDHRAAAERHAAAGEWPEAIRERLRAIARDLEERVILDPRPGRTADELAAEAGAALPPLADELRTGVRIFDEVWYGDRPGGPEGYAALVSLDEHVRTAKPRALRPEAADRTPASGATLEPGLTGAAGMAGAISTAGAADGADGAGPAAGTGAERPGESG